MDGRAGPQIDDLGGDPSKRAESREHDQPEVQQDKPAVRHHLHQMLHPLGEWGEVVAERKWV
jgi:hypothetical protein